MSGLLHKSQRAVYCLLLLLALVLGPRLSYANTKYPFFIGVSGGYGVSEWSLLTVDPLSAAAVAAPIDAKDGGFAGGFLLGYNISANFAVVFNYIWFPKTQVTFGPFNEYQNPPSFYGFTMSSNSSAYAFYGKFIVPIGCLPKLAAFAIAGLAHVHRDDVLANIGHLGAIFGLGMMYSLTPHFSVQTAFQFYTGFGKASVLPALTYVPFLYQVQVALAYHFRL